MFVHSYRLHLRSRLWGKFFCFLFWVLYFPRSYLHRSREDPLQNGFSSSDRFIYCSWGTSPPCLRLCGKWHSRVDIRSKRIFCSTWILRLDWRANCDCRPHIVWLYIIFPCLKGGLRSQRIFWVRRVCFYLGILWFLWVWFLLLFRLLCSWSFEIIDLRLNKIK